MKNKYIAMSIGLLFLILCPLSPAQEVSTIPEMTAGNFFGIGARAMGMGGAHIASVLDGSALYYNPAALAKIRRIEMQAGISHQSLDNQTDGISGFYSEGFGDISQNNTRLNCLNLSIPYPTYRGSLVFAFGLNRVKSFDQAFRHVIPDEADTDKTVYAEESESGSLYALSAGAGIDISPKVSVGASLNYYFGKDDYYWDYREENIDTYIHFRDNIEDSYQGISAKMGFLVTPGNRVKFGLTVESPVYYNIDEEFVQRTQSRGTNDDIQAGRYEYDLRTPFKLGAGIAVNLNYLQLSADINYADWSQMEYQDDPLLESENLYIDNFYRDALGFSIGAEYLIPRVGLKLRAGFMSDPLPWDYGIDISTNRLAGRKVIDDRRFFTFGAGYLIDRIMTLDIAVVFGGYKFEDVSTNIVEDYDLTRMYITTGFRL